MGDPSEWQSRQTEVWGMTDTYFLHLECWFWTFQNIKPKHFISQQQSPLIWALFRSPPIILSPLRNVFLFCFADFFLLKLGKYILPRSKDNTAINYATELTILQRLARKGNWTLKGPLFCGQKYRWENSNWKFEGCMAVLTALSTKKTHCYFCTTSSALSAKR